MSRYRSVSVHFVWGPLWFLYLDICFQVFSSVQSLVVFDSLWPHESQHARPSFPLPTPRVHPNSCPLSQWCHPAISSSVIPFSFCLQSFPESRSFPMSQFFTSDGQSIGASASASVLPMNIQDWFLLEWTCLISLHSFYGEVWSEFFVSLYVRNYVTFVSFWIFFIFTNIYILEYSWEFSGLSSVF